MKKNGFTLVELLVVVAILAMLVALVVPNVMESYHNSLKKDMEIQENGVVDAANIFIRDFCYSPITQENLDNCPVYFKDKMISGVNYRYVLLDDLVNLKFIPAVYYSDVKCKGFVLYQKNDNERYNKNPKAYLKCSTVYQTETGGKFNYSDFGL